MKFALKLIGGTQFTVTIISGVNEIFGIAGTANLANAANAPNKIKIGEIGGIEGNEGTPKHFTTEELEKDCNTDEEGKVGILGCCGIGTFGIRGIGKLVTKGVAMYIFS